MNRRPFVALLGVFLVACLLLLALFLARLPGAQPPNTLALAVPAASSISPSSSVTPTANPAATATTVAPELPTLRPAATRVIQPWGWVKPGFGGLAAITLTHGIAQYVYCDWSTGCDAPSRRQVPMIAGTREFYRDHVALAELFNGPCNDGRPLLFLNEPARPEQADISPVEAAHMFFTMTRGMNWPYERWHGPIYAGNNLVEERDWDAEFVRQFAKLHNNGSLSIPEIAGWGIHLYGNYEYGPTAGRPNTAWTDDVPAAEISKVVDLSMRQVDKYLEERKAEGNATSLLVTEFGLLQASNWHKPPTFYYTTTASFMEEYVRRFDLRPEIQAWFSFISKDWKFVFLDANLMIDANGALTPNGLKWRELAKARQRAD